MTPFKFTFLLLFVGTALSAQTTYTWNVSRGDWTAPSSWSPARNTPASTDILVFNGSVMANACATGIPTQTIGKLRIINNVNVRLIAKAPTIGLGIISRSASAVTGVGTSFNTDLKIGDLITNGTTFYGEVSSITSSTSMVVSASGTLSSVPYAYATSLNLNDGTNTALDITSGSTLTMSDTAMVLRVLSGSKGQIQGIVRLLNTRQRILGLDSASVIFAAGAVIRTDSTFSGNPFSIVGVPNSVIFQAGSTFDFYIGSNPFALTAPASKVIFAPGSNYIQSSSNTPSISGRNLANFIYNVNAVITATQNGVATIDSIFVQQGQFNLNASNSISIKQILVNGGVFNINLTGGNANISGNINVATGAKLVLQGKYTSTLGNVNFSGITAQSISGFGEIRIANTADSAVRFRIQNPAGVTLHRNLDLNSAYLDLDSGTLNLNNNILSIGSNSLVARSSQLNGMVKGPGTLTRWFTTASSIAGDSSLFGVGNNGLMYPIWVFGTPTSAGTVSLTSFTLNSGVTSFTNPFYDSAITAGIIVNSRLGHAWTLTTGNGLAGSNFGVRVRANVSAGLITDVTQMRLTVANGIAPGAVSEDGSGTITQPIAGKLGITTAQLNNTFYLGSNSSANPLPVRFIRITGHATQKGNEINWRVVSEKNVVQYIVERLEGEVDFIFIGQVNAQNQSIATNYTWLDQNVVSAVYRITAVDIDGKTTHSQLLFINRKAEEVNVYPNPVMDVLNMKGLNVENSIVKVYNYIGEYVNVSALNQTIDVSKLAAGVYYLTLCTPEGNKVVKFLKQ